MSFEKLINSFRKIQIIGWSVYFVLMFVTFLSADTNETIVYIFFVKLQRSLTGFIFTCILYFFYKRFINPQSIGKTVAIVFVLSIIIGVIWTALEVLFFSQTLAGYDAYKVLPKLPRIAFIYALTIIAWSAVYFGIEYWKQWQRERENVLQAKILAEKAQLETLRYQLNPHFLLTRSIPFAPRLTKIKHAPNR